MRILRSAWGGNRKTHLHSFDAKTKIGRKKKLEPHYTKNRRKTRLVREPGRDADLITNNEGKRGG